MERDFYGMDHIKSYINFNSHAHVERDFLAKRHINHANISTHTLTWSVTMRVEVLRLRNEISTHTLTWSVTNETTEALEKVDISTHTLTWSVTLD